MSGLSPRDLSLTADNGGRTTRACDSEEEHLVLEISKERHNKKKERQEYFVTWSDGTARKSS